MSFSALSFRANARNLFRSRLRRSGRKAENGKHRTAWDWGSRCFMQTALRRKTETGNEKDPSAALGMTKRERYISHSLSIRCGSQPPPLRGTSFQGKEGEPRMPLSPHRHFERMREIFFVRGKTKDVRIAASGKHRTPCDWGLGASFGQLYEGKRKRETKKIPRLRSG